jgi:hypothetical protein
LARVDLLPSFNGKFLKGKADFELMLKLKTAPPAPAGAAQLRDSADSS